MKTTFEEIKKAVVELKNIDNEKLRYVQECYEEYEKECSLTDDELNFIGHPLTVKEEWKIEALEYGLMEAEEFERVFGLVVKAGMMEAMAYC